MESPLAPPEEGREHTSHDPPPRPLWRAVTDLTPLTPVGAAALTCALYLLWSYGEGEHDVLLAVSMKLVVALLAILVTLTLLEAWRLSRWSRRQLPLPALEAEVGQELSTGLTLPGMGLSQLFNVRVRWLTPQPLTHALTRSSGGLLELVSFGRRGRVERVWRELMVEDIFGFCAVRWRWAQRADLTLLPRSSAASAAPLLQLQDGEDLYDPAGQPDGDLVELRRYQEGDPLKLVMWRLYARSRQLMVRTPERAQSLKRDLVAYLITDPTDEPSASTARAYLEGGLLGEDFTLFADGCQGGASDLKGATEHLLCSATGAPLEALPQVLSLPTARQRGCVLFCSAATPLESLLTVVRALPTPPLVVLSFPELATSASRGGLRGLFLREERAVEWAGQLTASGLMRTYQSLREAGARLQLVSQPGGAVVSDFELAKMAGEVPI